MTEELRKRMASLRSIAPKLNKASDTAASVIAKVEEFLGGLHVGIEGRADPYEERADPDSEEGQPQTIRSRLAYGRINGKFAIHVVREKWTKIVLSANWRDNDPNDEPEFVSEERIAWSSVGRQEKLKAFATIEGVLDAVELEAREVEDKANAVSDKIADMLATLGQPHGVMDDAMLGDGMDTSDVRPIRYRPERPSLHPPRDYECDFNFYKVCRGTKLIFAYDAAYYPSAKIVAEDLKRRIASQLESEGPTEEGFEVESPDVAIWRDDRLMAVIHYHYNDPNHKTTVKIFDEKDSRGFSNDKGQEYPKIGWPTREEWIEDGGDKIILRPFEVVDLQGEKVMVTPEKSHEYFAELNEHFAKIAKSAAGMNSANFMTRTKPIDYSDRDGTNRRTWHPGEPMPDFREVIFFVDDQDQG